METTDGASGHCGEKKSTGAAADGPTDPDAAPNCPVPPAAVSPCLFRGDDRDDNPFSDSGDEDTEARLILTAAFCGIRW